MSVLGSLAWRELTQLPHPAIQAQQCLNTVRRSHCQRCADLCPEGVIGPDGTVKSWSACTDCGRCVTACPTRAIAPSEHRLKQLLALRESEQAKLWLSCEASSRRSDFPCGCLCELSWEGLASIAFYRHLVLDLSPCPQCSETECRELLKQQLILLHRFLGAESFEQAITLTHTADKSLREESRREEERFSRRSLFRSTVEKSGQGMKALLRQVPLLGGEELALDGLSLRRLLNRQMKQSAEVFHWEIPALNENCTGCGLCEGCCPTKALRVDREQGMVVLESWKCVQCRSCVTACPNKAITGLEPVQIQQFSPLCLGRFSVKKCRDCGAALPPNGKSAVCPSCLQKRMRLAAKRSAKREGLR